MRFVLIPALALALAAGAAVAADPLSPEAEAGLAIAKQYAKSDKIKFRKVKVGADGNVCGLASIGSDRDTEFMVNPTEQTLWIYEDAKEPYSDFGYGEKILRSADRPAFGKWKACQSGK
ncbi:hypothetical protein GVN21_05645 [Caulobacter sp. SLTY]|uniref:hypothetical protein n=1 Tax=Caulobacter sp. SLTY TaxID=2683262 RepID=UPI001412BCBE|nr:hypothetical protein [Caulobacter sp. SLTY]NBB14846.1 hypothetical protein [Caulobacter sp. SLTY]